MKGFEEGHKMAIETFRKVNFVTKLKEASNSPC